MHPAEGAGERWGQGGAMTSCVNPSLPVILDGDPANPVIVFVNSITMTTRLWEPQVAALREQFCLVRFDQRGHGAAHDVAPAHSIADLGRDLIAILDSHSLDAVALCGLSLGGLVSMWVAAHHSARVTSLILACTTAFPDNSAKWRERAGQALRDGVPAVIEKSSVNWLTPGCAAARPQLLADLRAVAGTTNAAGYAGCCEALAEADLRGDLAQIRAPTLILAGAADRAFPLAHAEALRDGIASAELVVLPDVAHLANVEAPLEFTDHLRRHVGRAGPVATTASIEGQQ